MRVILSRFIHCPQIPLPSGGALLLQALCLQFGLHDYFCRVCHIFQQIERLIVIIYVESLHDVISRLSVLPLLHIRLSTERVARRVICMHLHHIVKLLDRLIILTLCHSITSDTHVSHHATSIQFDESLVVLIRLFILLLLIVDLCTLLVSLCILGLQYDAFAQLLYSLIHLTEQVVHARLDGMRHRHILLILLRRILQRLVHIGHRITILLLFHVHSRHPAIRITILRVVSKFLFQILQSLIQFTIIQQFHTPIVVIRIRTPHLLCTHTHRGHQCHHHCQYQLFHVTPMFLCFLV